MWSPESAHPLRAETQSILASDSAAANLETLVGLAHPPPTNASA